VFYAAYVPSELRRRGGRTVLTELAGRAPHIVRTEDGRCVQPVTSGPPSWKAEPDVRVRVLGRPSLTNARLATAFRARGYEAAVVSQDEPIASGSGDVTLARLDVLPSLDGVEPGLRRLEDLERVGGVVLNRPAALLRAHDKLATAIALGRAGVPHPRTAHVHAARPAPSFGPPYVVKPRFGSWGRDVFRCDSVAELAVCLERIGRRGWFRRQGALVQELVAPSGRDLRLVVAAGEVVGAVERVAPPGEWRTNVALGALRRPVEPPCDACAAARRAAGAVGTDLAGVDVLTRGDGTSVVLEVNGAVDFTSAYALAGSDPFAAAVDSLVGPPRAAVLAASR
jgi:RimK family alpha-L-glutamate ligase